MVGWLVGRLEDWCYFLDPSVVKDYIFLELAALILRDFGFKTKIMFFVPFRNVCYKIPSTYFHKKIEVCFKAIVC